MTSEGHLAPDAGTIGDWIEVRAVGDAPARRGEIVEVLGAPGHVHYHVRWDEEHESIFYPAHAEHVIHRHATER